MSGWDDPRMPTICGLRRRGYTPEAIKNFYDRIGLAKRNSVVDVEMLEYCIREDLNKHAQRVMAVLNPLKVVIENYPEDMVEELMRSTTRKTRVWECGVLSSLYIEQDDFREEPPLRCSSSSGSGTGSPAALWVLH